MEDSRFLEKYETKFDGSSIKDRSELLDAKLKEILKALAESFKEGAIPDVIKEGLKLLYAPLKVLPRNFFYQFEVERMRFCSNLLLSR